MYQNYSQQPQYQQPQNNPYNRPNSGNWEWAKWFRWLLLIILICQAVDLLTTLMSFSMTLMNHYNLKYVIVNYLVSIAKNVLVAAGAGALLYKQKWGIWVLLAGQAVTVLYTLFQFPSTGNIFQNLMLYLNQMLSVCVSAAPLPAIELIALFTGGATENHINPIK